MFKSKSSKIAVALAAVAILTSSSAQSVDEVARLKGIHHFLTGQECSQLHLYPPCAIYAIANMEYGPGEYPNTALDDPTMKDKLHLTFWVYNQGEEIDEKLAKIDARMNEMQKTIARDRQVMDETSKAILVRFDKFPAELPADNHFYQQVLTRLKMDIKADLQNAKGQVAEPPK